MYVPVPGLDLPLKLRRLGNGKVLSADQVIELLTPFDRDGDGEVTQEELTVFLIKSRVGGPWFCQVLSKTLWQIAQDRWGTEVTSMSVETLGQIIAFSMARQGRPAKRYVLTPDAVRGLEPKKDLDGKTVVGGSGPLTSAPRASSGGPRPRSSGGNPPPRKRPSGGRPRGRASGRGRPRRPGAKPRR